MVDFLLPVIVYRDLCSPLSIKRRQFSQCLKETMPESIRPWWEQGLACQRSGCCCVSWYFFFRGVQWNLLSISAHIISIRRKQNFNKASEQPWKSNGMGTKCKENPKGKGKPRREENTQGLSSSLYPEFPSKSKFQEFWIFQSMLLV